MTFTPERIALVRAMLEITDEPLALSTLPAALDEIERLQEANEELERNAEIVSANFEKDCWRAMRKLLEMTGYDFTDEGVTADEAFEHLADDIKAGNAQLNLISDERNRLKTELDEAVGWLEVVGMSAGWQYMMFETRDEIRSFLSRMEGRKDG